MEMDDLESEEQIWGSGDNGVLNWEHGPLERTEEGSGDFRILVMWDQEEEVEDNNNNYEIVRERRPRRPRVDLEDLRRQWMEYEAELSAGGTDLPTTSGKRRRTEEGDASGQPGKKKAKKRRTRKNKKRK